MHIYELYFTIIELNFKICLHYSEIYTTHYTKALLTSSKKKVVLKCVGIKLKLSSTVNNMFEYLINSTLGILRIVM